MDNKTSYIETVRRLHGCVWKGEHEMSARLKHVGGNHTYCQ